jgi:hypothetical protein
MNRYIAEQPDLSVHVAACSTRSALKQRIHGGRVMVQPSLMMLAETNDGACSSGIWSNFRSAEMSLTARNYSSREVTMTGLNHGTEGFTGIEWKLGIFFFGLILFGTFFTTPDSNAQAVPPRVQTLQMIRPPAPPPEPPIQKEIRELKKEVQATTPITYYGGQLSYLRGQLACYQECRIRGGKICGGPLPPGVEQNPRPFCELRAEALRRQIADIEARVAKLKGVNK